MVIDFHICHRVHRTSPRRTIWPQKQISADYAVFREACAIHIRGVICMEIQMWHHSPVLFHASNEPQMNLRSNDWCIFVLDAKTGSHITRVHICRIKRRPQCRATADLFHILSKLTIGVQTRILQELTNYADNPFYPSQALVRFTRGFGDQGEILDSQSICVSYFSIFYLNPLY